MPNTSFQYLYGPVHSWRLGNSLGIDPLSQERKVCNMDCSYCQLGRSAEMTLERRDHISVEELMSEVECLPDVPIDHFTFSGRGEPTLARNLGELILSLKSVRPEKIAVITNSLLMNDPQVREELCWADTVLAKLDAANEKLFEEVNGPPQGTRFLSMLSGLRRFRSMYGGRFCLQVMLLPGNREYAEHIADIARMLAPDEVQLNTPTRPCGCPPLSRKEMHTLTSFFSGLPVISIFDQEARTYTPFNAARTKRRHGSYEKSQIL